MKFPRTTRLDDTDDLVYPTAAQPGEPAVPGSFLWEFEDADPATLQGKRKQAFRNGFLGVDSFGFSTFVTVGEISDTEYKRVIERLAQHFVEHFGAPDIASALPRARAEVEYAVELCDRDPNLLIAVERTSTLGDIAESYRSIDPGQHWSRGETRPIALLLDDGSGGSGKA